MLDITRIETGHFELHPVATNITQMLEEICELLAPRAHEKQLEIATICEAGLPRNIMVDERRLRQVLINLLGNAIKFTCNGGVSIRAMLGTSPTGEITVQFAICDTGPGIADDDKARIFEEFEQANMDVTRKFGGAGPGLVDIPAPL